MKEVDADDILGTNLSLPLFKDFRLIMSDVEGGEWMVTAIGFCLLIILIVIFED